MKNRNKNTKIDLSKFKQSRTAEATLSTGHKIPVREMSVGTLRRLAKLVPNRPDGMPDFNNMGLEARLEAASIIALECASSDVFPLVNKPAHECGDEEISVEMLGTLDLGAIFQAAVGLFMLNNQPKTNPPTAGN